MPRPFYIHEIQRPFDDDRFINPERIAKTLGHVIGSHALSLGRRHPLVETISDPKKSPKFVASLIERSNRPSSPVQAYLLFRGTKTFDRLVGLAISIEDTPIQYRSTKREIARDLENDFTQIQTWVGVGGYEELSLAYKQIKNITNKGNEVAIEPIDSSDEVHQLLGEVFGNPTKGYFSSGVKTGAESIAYGLKDTSLEINAI